MSPQKSASITIPIPSKDQLVAGVAGGIVGGLWGYSAASGVLDKDMFKQTMSNLKPSNATTFALQLVKFLQDRFDKNETTHEDRIKFLEALMVELETTKQVSLVEIEKAKRPNPRKEVFWSPPQRGFF